MGVFGRFFVFLGVFSCKVTVYIRCENANNMKKRRFTHYNFEDLTTKKKLRKAKFLNEIQSRESIDDTLEIVGIQAQTLSDYFLDSDFQEAFSSIAPYLTARALVRLHDIMEGTDSSNGADTRLRAATKILDTIAKQYTGIEFDSGVRRQEAANRGQKESIITMLQGKLLEKAYDQAERLDPCNETIELKAEIDE